MRGEKREIEKREIVEKPERFESWSRTTPTRILSSFTSHEACHAQPLSMSLKISIYMYIYVSVHVAVVCTLFSSLIRIWVKTAVGYIQKETAAASFQRERVS